jgi:hypothetical protein
MGSWHLTEVGRWILWAKEALEQGKTRRRKQLKSSPQICALLLWGPRPK